MRFLRNGGLWTAVHFRQWNSIMPHRIVRYFAKEICVRDCNTCEKVGYCFNRRAWTKPIPGWTWGVTFLAAAVPLLIASRPVKSLTSMITFVLGDEIIEPASEERLNVVRKLFREIGVEADNICVLETRSAGPTVVGVSGATGIVVLIPQTLMDLCDETMHLNIMIPDELGEGSVSWSGPVGEITDEMRARLLHESGLLLPTPEEVRFIIGHEASHVLLHHSLRTGLTVAAGLALSHLALKCFNLWRVSRHRTPVRGIVKHTAISLVGVLAGVLAGSWQTEQQADINSARTLGLQEAARALALKKQQQNLVTKQQDPMGRGKFITSNGNDLLAVEHPPITHQITYLSRIGRLEDRTPD